jgi:hypothetical protein
MGPRAGEMLLPSIPLDQIKEGNKNDSLLVHKGRKITRRDGRITCSFVGSIDPLPKKKQ